MAVTSDLDARIMAAIADALPTSQRIELHAETRLGADLGLDSLGVLALLFRLQEVFEVELEDDADVDAAAPRTIGDVVELTRTLLAADDGAGR